MPEIIEVEKMKRLIDLSWKGRFIKEASCALWSPYRGSWLEFRERVLGRKIENVVRKGKYLWLELAGGVCWRIHLWSTGWFLPANDKAVSNLKGEVWSWKFLHKVDSGGVKVWWAFDDGAEINYYDPRTFGEWGLEPKPIAVDSETYKKLGPDWLTEPDRAKEKLLTYQRAGRVIGVLRDQTVTAGLGNYLSHEILWRAKISPYRPYVTLSEEDRKELLSAVEIMLDESMRTVGHDHWEVFKRKGKPCRRCKTIISYIKSTPGPPCYMCLSCQK